MHQSAVSIMQKKIGYAFLQSIFLFIGVGVILNIVFVFWLGGRIRSFDRPGGVWREKSIAIGVVVFLLIGVPLIYLRGVKRRMIGVVVNDIRSNFSHRVCELIVSKLLESVEHHEHYVQDKAVAYQRYVRSFPLRIRWVMRALQFFFPVVQAFQSLIEKIASDSEVKKEELTIFFHEQMQAGGSGLRRRVSSFLLRGVVVIHVCLLFVLRRTFSVNR